MNQEITSQFVESLEKNSEKKIGEILNNYRLEKKLSTSEVANYLKVKEIDIIKAEENDFKFLEKKLYLAGFLKSYAKFLKIDDKIAEELIKKIEIKPNIENKKHQLIDSSETLSPDKILFIKMFLASILCFLFFLLIFKISNSQNVILEEKIYQEFNKIDIE